MGLTNTAAKWGVGPTLVATLIGGTALGASVAVYEYQALGSAIGAISHAASGFGPAMKAGQDAVDAKIGAPAPAKPAPKPAKPAR